jgi:hypothetical protein
VIVVSMEGLDDARETQAEYPHLLVIADENRGLSEVAELVHAKANPNGKDADAPTTILVDRQGVVRWLHRSSVIARLSPDEVLAAVKEYMPE